VNKKSVPSFLQKSGYKHRPSSFPDAVCALTVLQERWSAAAASLWFAWTQLFRVLVRQWDLDQANDIHAEIFAAKAQQSAFHAFSDRAH